MKKYISIVAVIALILSLLSGCGSKEVARIGAKSYEVGEKIAAAEGYQKIAEDGGLELYLNSTDGMFCLKNSAAENAWYSSNINAEEDPMAGRMIKLQMQSAMIIYYYDAKTGETSNTNSNTGAEIEIGKRENGFCVWYTYEYLSATIPLEIYLENGSLVADIDFGKAVFRDENILITRFELLPYFCHAQAADNGYLFIPDGSGAIINFNNGKEALSYYERRIYGEEPTDETAEFALKTQNQAIALPVFGVKKGENAILAIAEDGAENGFINAYTNYQKSSVANVYSSYNLTSSMNYSIGSQESIVYDKYGISSKRLKMRYYLLSGEDANYSGMARKYREYLGNKYSFVYKPSKTTLFAEFYGGVAKKVSHLGFITTDIIPLTTASEATDIISKLSDKGVKPIVSYRNWNTAELKNSNVNSFKLSSNLEKGGKLKKLSISYDMALSVYNLTEYSGGNIFSNMSAASFSLMGLPFKWDNFSIGTLADTSGSYNRTAGNKLKDNGIKLIKQTAKKDFSAMAFSDIANSLYCDYREERYYRADIARVCCEILEYADKNLDKVMLSRPNSYAIEYADFIFNTPISHSNHELLDESVPFYAIAISGLVDYAAPAFNSSNNGDDADLLSIISGCMPSYSWMNEKETVLMGTELSRLSNVNYKATFNEAVDNAKLYSEIKSATGKSAIYSQGYLEKDLSVTEYENGTCVYVNLSDSQKTLPNGDSLAAKSCIVIKGE